MKPTNLPWYNKVKSKITLESLFLQPFHTRERGKVIFTNKCKGSFVKNETGTILFIGMKRLLLAAISYRHHRHPGETTPEQAHEIGRQLADEVLQGKYDAKQDRNAEAAVLSEQHKGKIMKMQ